MALRRPTFHAELSDGTTHTVEIVHVDQLRAELEARKQGIPVSFELAPVAITTLWVWAALVRMEVCEVGYQEFSQAQLVQLQRASADLPESEAVDPTPQDPPDDSR